MRKTILPEHESRSMKKTARKSTKYWRNETILKIGHLVKARAHAKAMAFAKWSVWVKNYAKNMKETIFQKHNGCSVQKTARKNNTKYSRNETILIICDLVNAIAHAKAIAFAKW